MPVLLHQSNDLPNPSSFDIWITVGETPATGPSSQRIVGIGSRLEAAFKAIGPAWWGVGKTLGGDPSASVAHMPHCGAYGSDFGLMLAWSRLVEEAAQDAGRVLVLCDDPWMFRHLATLSGVTAGPAPNLWGPRLKKAVRGMLARLKVSFSVMRAARTTRSFVANAARNTPALLVYGHPASRADGYDDYFGTLMTDEPALTRLLHTDCPAPRAAELAADGRTASLHSFGSLAFALTLPFIKWRPNQTTQPQWLIRRAAMRENSGGGPAMNAWQNHCQRRWLERNAPTVVMWPWENHGWERQFCRSARHLGIASVGYQHTTIGPYQFNYSPHGNTDPAEELPDAVVANGPATRQEMADWGVPIERLVIGGTYRLPRFDHPLYDPKGAIFVPLSANPQATKTQIDAARLLADAGYDVVIKDHPMYPAVFEETDRLKRTHQSLRQLGGVRALIYATGTMGLQGLLAGVPTLRLTLDSTFGMDVLPKQAAPLETDLAGLLEAVAQATPSPLAWLDILAPVDGPLWHRLVQSVKTPQDVAEILARHHTEEALPS